MNWPLRSLQAWGRLNAAPMRVAAPASEDAALARLREAEASTWIPFGAGRSYGDQALNGGGAALLTGGLGRVLAVDADEGTLVAEAGLSIGEALRTCLAQGWLPPVSPGTGFATLGGCLANDVHGKNHESHGSFGRHVLWFDLLLPSGEVRRVSPNDEPLLFNATVGGMGLTGLILRMQLKLQRAHSNAVDLVEERIPNLEAFVERFEQVRATAPYSVGWIDAMAQGASLGRGILETATSSAEGLPPYAPKRLGLPCDLPGFVLGPFSVRAFNTLYYRRIAKGGRQRQVHIEKFLYPLDALRDWNRLYGRRGFFQFQCVLPDAQATAGLRVLLEAVSRSRASSFLAVLKTMGPAGSGFLSFPLRGYTLALDIPNRPDARALLAGLERLTLEHGGRIYLAKDAALSAAGFARMYPQAQAFRALLEHIDPHARMSSDMARRLGLRPSRRVAGSAPTQMPPLH
jgi:decaprenylphospho-beta-D-ribofuranose 2-oxidase